MVSDNKYYVGSKGLQALIDKIAELKEKTWQEIQDEICREHEPIHAQLDDHETRIGAAEGRLDAVEQRNEEQDNNLQDHVAANDKKFNELDAKDAALEAKDVEQDDRLAAIEARDLVEWQACADENLPERTSIVMRKLGDVILAADATGATFSLAQLNRWDVMDFGSSAKKFNINTPAGVRPTIQEAGQSGEQANQMAYLSDITLLNETITAALQEHIQENNNKFAALDAKDAALEAKDVEQDETTATLRSEFDALKAIAVTYSDVATGDNPGRRAITLNNHDTILGKATNGAVYNLVMLSKWDKADFGSASVVLNLNGSAARPTYNDTKEIALLEDVEASNAALEAYKTSNDARVKAVEDGLAAVPGEIDARIQEVIGAAPDALDTLKELADALGNDADFATTVTNNFAQRDAKDAAQDKALEDYRLEANGRLDAIEAKNDEQDGRLDAVESDLANYENSNNQRLDGIEAKNAEQDQALNDYKTSNDARVKAVEDKNVEQDAALEEYKTSNDARVKAVEDKNVEQDAALEEYKTSNDARVQAIEKANTTQDETTAALRSEFNVLKSDYEAVKADYEAVKADYEAYKTANDAKIAEIVAALNNLVTGAQVAELFADAGLL